MCCSHSDKKREFSAVMTNEDNTNTLLIKKIAVQKDLGVLITANLKWNQLVNNVCWKANRMLGFVKDLQLT